MAVPSYDDLLKRHDMRTVEMRDAIPNTQLMEISSALDRWERLGRALGLDSSDIESIKGERNTEEEKPDKLLQKWKQRRGFAATYEELAKALLQIKRTDLAEIVVSLRLKMSASPADSGGMEVASPLSDTPPTHVTTATSVSSVSNNSSIAQTLSQLEEDFFQLVLNIEVTLEECNIGLNTITRRFSMLPHSVKRRYESDQNYRETKHKILESTTIKRSNNLTDLKH